MELASIHSDRRLYSEIEDVESITVSLESIKAKSLKISKCFVITSVIIGAILLSIGATLNIKPILSMGSIVKKVPFSWKPFSIVDPRSLGTAFLAVNRTDNTEPGPAFNDLVLSNVPLPTNNWAENLFLGSATSSQSIVFPMPYAIDTAGNITGIRTHALFLTASTSAVISNYEAPNGVTLGADENFNPQFLVVDTVDDEAEAVGRIILVLEWTPESVSDDVPYHVYEKIEEGDDASNAETTRGPRSPYSRSSGSTKETFLKTRSLRNARESDSDGAATVDNDIKASSMRALLARGSPYISMEYINSTPKLVVQRPILFAPVVDGKEKTPVLTTGSNADIETDTTDDYVYPGNKGTPNMDDVAEILAGKLVGVPQAEPRSVCGEGYGNYGEPFLVKSNVKLVFGTSDQTWLVFPSEPTEFVCYYVLPINTVSIPGLVPPIENQGYFELKVLHTCAENYDIRKHHFMTYYSNYGLCTFSTMLVLSEY